MKTVKLGTTVVGENQPPYIIAEIGSNHNGDMDLCRRLIDAAAEAGADAVKFQSWSESSLIANEEYERNPEYADKKKHFGSLREMVRAYQFTPEQHGEALDYCRRARHRVSLERLLAAGGRPAGQPRRAVHQDRLHGHHQPAAAALRRPRPAGRWSSPPAWPRSARSRRPCEAVEAEGNDQIVLLHCVSIYPPEYETIHLRNMAMLRETFDVPVGFSDHTLGTAIPLAAIALGACVIEKHFTLDKDMAGWDHAISADPAELRAIVEEGRNVFTALGSTGAR